MATEDVERDAPDAILGSLRDLVQSAGWQLLKQQAAHEWGPEGYGRQMQHALSTIPAGPERAYELARVAEQVDATAKAVHALIQWPEEQIRQLAPSKPARRFDALRRITR